MDLASTSESQKRVMDLLVDFQGRESDQIRELASGLDVRLIRWVAMYHPTNWVRTILYGMSNVVVGEGATINARLTVFDDYRPMLTIGARAAIASDVTVVCISSPNESRLGDLPYVRESLIQEGPVVIGEDAWVGARSVIMPGVSVGPMAIVGAGSVVLEDVPKGAVMAGAPARTVRRLL